MFSVEDILRENVFFFGVWLYFLKCFKTHYMVFCMMKKKKFTSHNALDPRFNWPNPSKWRNNETCQRNPKTPQKTPATS